MSRTDPGANINHAKGMAAHGGGSTRLDARLAVVEGEPQASSVPH